MSSGVISDTMTAAPVAGMPSGLHNPGAGRVGAGFLSGFRTPDGLPGRHASAGGSIPAGAVGFCSPKGLE